MEERSDTGRMHRTTDEEGPADGLFVPEGWEGPGPKYQLVKNLNSGSYGQVQLAIDTQTGERVAIKLMERGSKITKYVEREVVNAAKLLHPHIVQVSIFSNPILSISRPFRGSMCLASRDVPLLDY